MSLFIADHGVQRDEFPGSHLLQNNAPARAILQASLENDAPFFRGLNTFGPASVLTGQVDQEQEEEPENRDAFHKRDVK